MTETDTVMCERHTILVWKIQVLGRQKRAKGTKRRRNLFPAAWNKSSYTDVSSFFNNVWNVLIPGCYAVYVCACHYVIFAFSEESFGSDK